MSRKNAVRAGDVKRALARQVAEAILALRNPEVNDEAIHEVRKKLKSARAKLRLLRPVVGGAAYRRENAALRDAARPLSPVRDAKVLLDTLDAMLLRMGSRKRRLLLTALRGRLKQAHACARAELLTRRLAAASASALERASRRIVSWDAGTRRTRLLGEDRDLAVLTESIASEEGALHRHSASLPAEVSKRRGKLQRKAVERSRKLLRIPPRAWAQRIG